MLKFICLAVIFALAYGQDGCTVETVYQCGPVGADEEFCVPVNTTGINETLFDDSACKDLVGANHCRGTNVPFTADDLASAIAKSSAGAYAAFKNDTYDRDAESCANNASGTTVADCCEYPYSDEEVLAFFCIEVAGFPAPCETAGTNPQADQITTSDEQKFCYECCLNCNSATYCDRFSGDSKDKYAAAGVVSPDCCATCEDDSASTLSAFWF